MPHTLQTSDSNKNEVIKYDQNHQLFLKTQWTVTQGCKSVVLSVCDCLTLVYEVRTFINTAPQLAPVPHHHHRCCLWDFHTFVPPLHFIVWLSLSSVSSVDFRTCLKKGNGDWDTTHFSCCTISLAHISLYSLHKPAGQCYSASPCTGWGYLGPPPACFPTYRSDSRTCNKLGKPGSWQCPLGRAGQPQVSRTVSSCGMALPCDLCQPFHLGFAAHTCPLLLGL